ncbi:hypothetical protein ACA910_010945 [Epithemia clementina (nom. ined.)]
MAQSSWVPVIPAKYLPKASSLKSILGGVASITSSGLVSTITLSTATATSANPSTDSSNRREAQIINSQRNDKFKDFEAQLGRIKLNDVIKKVGPPPAIKRSDPEQGGKIIELPMCGSYHLWCVCNSKCNCRLEHAAHSEAEDKLLYDWCKVAFA